VPLSELIAALLDTTPYSKAVWEIYGKLINRFDTELNVLLNVPVEEMEKTVERRIAEIIIKNREGRLVIQPGYDGVYGKLMLNGEMPKQETIIENKNSLRRFL